jgi:hypothetical protein
MLAYADVCWRMLTYAVLACGDDCARGVGKDNARASVRHIRMRQVAIRPQVLHTSAYVSIRQHMRASVRHVRLHQVAVVHQERAYVTHTSAYCAYVTHTSALRRQVAVVHEKRAT